MGYGDEDEIIQEPNNGEVQEPNNGGMSFEAADGDQEPNNGAIQEPNNI